MSRKPYQPKTPQIDMFQPHREPPILTQPTPQPKPETELPAPVYYVVSPAQCLQWEVFALLCGKIANGRSKDFTELRKLESRLNGIPVVGVLTADNPCVRLRREALRAAHAAHPSMYFADMTELSDAVLTLLRGAA